MITGKLSNGYEVKVDEGKLKTYKFAKMIGKSVSSDVKERLYANAMILEFLLGEKGEEALLDYVEKTNGHEPTEKEMSDITVEIINLMKQENEEIKKSTSSEES
jgi:hypothetical protein